jgi:GT2 family glycosyltransferase
MCKRFKRALKRSASTWAILTTTISSFCICILFGPAGKSVLPICLVFLIAGILGVLSLVWVWGGMVISPLCRRLQLALIKRGEARRDARIARDAQSGAPIKVGLLLDLPSLWTMFAPIYDELSQDERFEVQVIAMPDCKKGKIVGNSSAEFLAERKVPHESLYRQGRLRSLNSYGFHYVFPSRHYALYRPAWLSNWRMRRMARMCHISYGACTFNGGIQDLVMDFKELQHYHAVFAETPAHAREFLKRRESCENCSTRIIITGSSKFDAIYYGDFSASESTYQQVILYTPRWTPDGNACTFLDYCEEFFALVEEHPEIKFILRPHPLMEGRFRGRVVPEEEWDEMFARFDEQDNAVVDRDPDYRNSFREATVLVSDMSSLIPEFILTGKPVVFAQKRWQFNEFGRSISRGLYRCHNWDEIENVLRNLREENDPKRGVREQVVFEDFYLGDSSAAERIKNVLLEDYYSSFQRTMSVSGGGASEEFPLVSVCVLCYNNSKYLFECLDSIVKQTYPNIELLINDDASVDFDADKVRSWIEHHKVENIKSMFINAGQTRMGTVRSLEELQSQSKGSFLLTVAADDVLYSDSSLMALYQTVCAHGSQNAVVMGQTLMYDHSLTTVMDNFMTDKNIEFLKSASVDELYEKTMVEVWLPACYLYNRSLLDYVNDVSAYSKFIEDIPFQLRILRMGVKPLYCDAVPTLKHRDGGVSHGAVANENAISLRYKCDWIYIFEQEIIPHMYRMSAESQEKILKRYLWYKRTYFSAASDAEDFIGAHATRSW